MKRPWGEAQHGIGDSTGCQVAISATETGYGCLLKIVIVRHRIWTVEFQRTPSN
jgi:hypothetical protein